MCSLLSAPWRRVLLSLVVVSLVAVVLGILANSATKPLGQQDFSRLQCGHWALIRSAQLVGVHVTQKKAVELLPYDMRGHSLLEITEALKSLAIAVEGRNDTLESLGSRGYPCILHLRQPDHFVVLSNIDERGRLHIYDGDGRRTMWSPNSLKSKFSGKIVYVMRDMGHELNHGSTTTDNVVSPRALFKTLLVDRGSVASSSGAIAFIYPFRNAGNSDLRIVDVRPDCGCIRVEAPTKPLLPNESDEIRLFYHVSSQKGPFTHHAVIETNDPLNAEIPIAASGYNGAEVSINPPRLSLGELVEGSETTTSCFLTYSGEDEDFRVDEVISTLAGTIIRTGFSASTKTKTGQSQRNDGSEPREPALAPSVRLLNITFRPVGEAGDTLEGSVFIHTNIRGYEHLTVPVRAAIVGPIKACPSVLTFGRPFAEGRFRDSSMLLSRLEEPFEILGYDCPCTGVEIEFPKGVNEREANLVITAGESALTTLSAGSVVFYVKLVSSGRTVSVPLKCVVLPDQ
jgi:hypothetical protein